MGMCGIELVAQRPGRMPHAEIFGVCKFVRSGKWRAFSFGEKGITRLWGAATAGMCLYPYSTVIHMSAIRFLGINY